MTNELVVDVQPKEVSIALLEDKSLVELQSEGRNISFSVGNMYLGRIKKLMPGLNACFVDVGYEKDAFLHYLDLGPQFNSLEKFVKQTLSDKKKLTSISKATLLPDLDKDGTVSNTLKVGQEVVVQIVKEPISTKGPRLTSEISFAGRYLVLIPFNDKVSVSLGGKYVYGIRKLSGHAEYSYNKSSPLGAIVDGNALHIDSKRTADGFGGILGIDIKPTDTLNIALKFETPVKLNFKASTSEDEKIYLGFLNRSLGISTFYPEYKDGNKMRRDLPAVLSAGVSNKINKVTLLFSYSHYFNKAANIDNQNYDDGNEAGIGIMYDINDKFTWTAGINIADTGASRATYDDTEFALNSQLYGTGVIFKPNEKNEFVDLLQRTDLEIVKNV